MVSANQFQEVRKFEVIAGRVERDGQMARRFVSALQRPSLARVLVAGALDQCGWVPTTLIDVISDGARGMRSLVTSIAPRVSPRILDWFHISMKMQAIRSSICAYNYFSRRPEIMLRSQRLLVRVLEFRFAASRVHSGASMITNNASVRCTRPRIQSEHSAWTCSYSASFAHNGCPHSWAVAEHYDA